MRFLVGGTIRAPKSPQNLQMQTLGESVPAMHRYGILSRSRTHSHRKAHTPNVTLAAGHRDGQKNYGTIVSLAHVRQV